MGLGWGLQAAAKQSGRSFLHPAATARGCGAETKNLDQDPEILVKQR